MEKAGSFRNSSKSTSLGPEGQPEPGRYFHNLQVTAPVERFPGVLGRQGGAYQPNCDTKDKGYTVGNVKAAENPKSERSSPPIPRQF